jgi:hypothetical protein
MLEFIAATTPGVHPFVTSPMGTLFSSLLNIIALVCWILEIVAAFKKSDGPLMGILSIVLCGLGGFIIGWIHNKQWGIQKVMLVWMITIVVGFVVYFSLGLSAAVS